MSCSVDAVDNPQLRFVGVKSVPKVLPGSLFKGGQNSSSQIKMKDICGSFTCCTVSSSRQIQSIPFISEDRW